MNLGSRLFENTNNNLKLVIERLKGCEGWEDLLEEGDIADREEYEIRQMYKHIATILNLFDKL